MTSVINFALRPATYSGTVTAYWYEVETSWAIVTVTV
jgi:hypothetical protein